MIPTNLIGRGKNSNGDKFEIDGKEHLVKKYPSGHKPIDSKFKEGSHRAHFNKKYCSSCPLWKDCLVVKQKKSYLFKVSETKLHYSKAYRQKKTFLLFYLTICYRYLVFKGHTGLVFAA